MITATTFVQIVTPDIPGNDSIIPQANNVKLQLIHNGPNTIARLVDIERTYRFRNILRSERFGKQSYQVVFGFQTRGKKASTLLLRSSGVSVSIQVSPTLGVRFLRKFIENSVAFLQDIE